MLTANLVFLSADFAVPSFFSVHLSNKSFLFVMRFFSVLFLGVMVISCGSARVESLDTSLSGKSTETTYEMVNENGQIQRGGEKVEYSDDGLTAVKTTYYTLDSLPTIIASRSVSTYDKKGRLIKREGFDPDETDEIHPRFSVDTYKYMGSRVVRTECTKVTTDPPRWAIPIVSALSTRSPLEIAA